MSRNTPGYIQTRRIQAQMALRAIAADAEIARAADSAIDEVYGNLDEMNSYIPLFEFNDASGAIVMSYASGLDGTDSGGQ